MIPFYLFTGFFHGYCNEILFLKKVRLINFLHQNLNTDTGKGIEKSQFKQIFKPGFTTKKRGWGLGLSLSKRIVEEYHNGKIFV